MREVREMLKDPLLLKSQERSKERMSNIDETYQRLVGRDFADPLEIKIALLAHFQYLIFQTLLEENKNEE